jgi:hypothetical protein
MHSTTVPGLYIKSNKIHWTPEVTLEGLFYLTVESNGPKGPNIHFDDDNYEIM